MKKKQERKRLGDLLVEAGLITEEQLEEALREKAPGQKLGDVLLQLGYITEQQLIEVLEFQLGIPHVSLYRYPIDPKLTNLIPKEFAKRHMVMPLKVEGERLLVAMADPMDFFVIDDLRLSTGFHIETAIASKDDILRAINKYYDMDESVEDFLQMALAAETTVEEERATEEDSPIVRLVNQILQLAVEQRASDVHIDPQETKVLVRYRIDGILRTDRALPKHMQSMLTARIKILANMDITEHRIPQDGRIKMNIDFHPVDLRVSTLPTIYGEKIVIRILDLGTALNDIHKLGFNQLNLRRFIELIERPNGIILITGPTGAGKSSTLYAALNHLNSEEVNIITIEDPVEYQIEGVNQIQVNPNIGLTFAQGLRSILRQDPNIIMVGEIRDRETAEVAIRASLTGHLVLSTLHTNDALSTITRLIDMGIEPFLVATSLAGVVSQRLVRRVCRDCQEEQEPTKREIEIFARRGMKIDKLIRGRGCPTCNMTGYKGRIAIHELLVMTDEMRRVILNKEPFSKLRELAIKNRMIFLIDDGLLKVKQGLTTLEEVLKVAILS
ncbi:GspE/PulE family protein [Parageobacillus thermoglucosidasius]|uniref:Type II secretion system protein GspE n=1 Tax=Parageobacillus thermoglucosidasius TaxID=1426 RepID=A0AAN1D884_PARTM|nr:ATPase, T2SS/T4P/T4SS family [Parageobacillus thermoglucosidasius]ALF11684.1 type II secretion system protein GspE [Parageobacillus thermoglucosidasius]ANZ31767.1 type II secretion system protein GspE [Parageobacillus thermoglucosidasius]APM82502.1 type II secretion system protein GspE [Parageobacillus thermoglucosidasius]KJX69578.1 type II secretion system protein E [Parageobacillus thermoglucosidasius]RDE26242.1 type II secretion system protein GspE [Parageobacillus thermoglucosidasius]